MQDIENDGLIRMLENGGPHNDKEKPGKVTTNDKYNTSLNICITRGAVVQLSPVLTAIGLVNGNPLFLTPTESTSLNLSLKFVTGDYVHDFYSCAKFGRNPSMGLLGK